MNGELADAADDGWTCPLCARTVRLVTRLHCRRCGEYHDVCLPCGQRLDARDDAGGPADLPELARSLGIEPDTDSLTIFTAGAREVHILTCRAQ